MQILWLLEKEVKVFNSVESLMFLNNKHWLGSYLSAKHPKTYISSDSDHLVELKEKYNNDTWILKPTAGSLGRDVFKIKPNDCNSIGLIQSFSNKKTGKYVILQKYVSEINSGEKRVLVVNDKVICYYLRKSISEDDFRTNLSQGALPENCELSVEERSLCSKIGKEFSEHGAYFIGIDLVYPYVIEVNVLNPGGLNTVWKLTGIDYSKEVINELFKVL